MYVVRSGRSVRNDLGMWIFVLRFPEYLRVRLLGFLLPEDKTDDTGFMFLDLCIALSC